MSRNIKAFGLVLMATFVLGAMSGPAAQATNHHLTVEGQKGIITAEDTVKTVFTVTNGEKKVECTTTKYEGTVGEKTNTETTVTPTYSGCIAFGFSAEIHVNHCAYLLKGETVSEDATAGIECAEGNDITITFFPFGKTCTIHVTAQSPSGGVHYTQSGNNVEIKATVAGIKYHETHDSFICPENHTGEDGTLEGTVLAKGFTDVCGSGLTGTPKTTPEGHYNTCEGVSQKLEVTTT